MTERWGRPVDLLRSVLVPWAHELDGWPYRARFALVLLTLTIYVLGMAAFSERAGPAARALGLLPVLASGWLLGLRSALVIGVAIVPLNVVIWLQILHEDWRTALLAGGFSLFMHVLIGGAFGWLRDLAVQVHHQAEELRTNELALGRQLVERQKIEQALRQSREEFYDLFEAAPVGYHELDREGRITRVNRTELAMLGYSADDLLGRYVWELVEPTEREVTQRSFAEHMAGRGSEQAIERTLLRNDGTAVVVAMQRSLLRDAAGQVAGLRTTLQDITPRKQAENRLVEALAALQEQHRQTELAQSQNQAVLDATSEAMLLIAPDRQILAVNRRFEELFAVRTDELVGQSFWAFRPYVERVYADPEALFKKVAGTASDTERHFTLDLTQVWPQARDLELHSTPVRSPSGQFVGRLYAFRDVTDERELLRQKDELVSIASHELRGPLAAIVGFTELLLDQDLAPDERRQFLELMLGEGERLTAILNDFLDLQRFESGRQTIQPRPDDLCALLQQAVAAAGIDVERPIQLSVPDDLPLVFMDHDRIRQVLTNLLGNARKYSPNGGEIQVTVQARADYVDVAVQDQGLGLPPEAFAQLFQKFYRVAGRERREITGTGLGLAICKQIVEAHGGRIWAESAGAKCGSRFTFTLPMVASSNGGV